MAAAALAPTVCPLTVLADGLDQLHDEEPVYLPSAALAERLRELFALRNRLDAEIVRHVAVFDRTHGYAACDSRSAASWLRNEARLSPGAASEQVRVARQLDRLPQVSRAFADGELGFQHAAVITRTVEDASAEVIGEAEPSLVQVAQRVDPFRLASLTRHLRHTFAPEACLEEANRAFERRRLHLSQSLDGVYFIEGVLDTECGATLQTALDAIMGPPAPGDQRRPVQRRADAIGDLARRHLDAGELPQKGGVRPHLTLTADLATLARLAGSRAADMDWGQPVPAETLRRIACDASVTPVLVSDTGDPLSAGRTRRVLSPSQRKALVARDRGCVLCGRPAVWCASHHLVHWVDGGDTSVKSSALLCNRCHRLVHEGGYRLVRRPDRTWTVIRDRLPP